MKILSLKSDLHIPGSSSNPPLSVIVKPTKLVSVSCRKNSRHPPRNFAITETQTIPIILKQVDKAHAPRTRRAFVKIENEHRRIVIMGAVSVGILVLVLSGMDEQKAWALGPEGPLVEEFWDNVRRYGLYALTVSTGALYTIFRPIVELLKNPITAIFILALFGGSIYIVSQVLSAMVGVSDFTYDFAY